MERLSNSADGLLDRIFVRLVDVEGEVHALDGAGEHVLRRLTVGALFRGYAGGPYQCVVVLEIMSLKLLDAPAEKSFGRWYQRSFTESQPVTANTTKSSLQREVV